MISKRQNYCTLCIGGAERTLKFTMNTEELYLSEKKKLISSGIDIENSYTQMKLLVFCALKMGDKDGSLPKDLSLETIGEWIGDCEDEKINDVIEFAETSMGFILSVEQQTLNRQIQQMKTIAPKKYEEIMSNLETSLI
jgi:hypothetical protein